MAESARTTWSDQEQVTTVIRRVDVDLDTMIRLNLSMINKLRGQCYDGCSSMSGAQTGVAKRIMDEEPCVIFTHCYGHSLNLASDTMKKS